MDRDIETMKRNFSANIQTLLNHFNLEPKSVHSMLEIRPITLECWIKGIKMPKGKWVELVAKHFSIDNPSDLFLDPNDFTIPEKYNSAVKGRKNCKKRTCLGCDKLFNSRSAAHRICSTCKALNKSKTIIQTYGVVSRRGRS